MLISRIYISLILTCIVEFAFAQENESKLFIQSKVTDGLVQLRWAPSTEDIWRECNRSGYVLSRTIIVRNKELVSPPETKVLSSHMPLSLGEWEKFKDNKLAVIAAQSLFGEEIRVDADVANDPLQLYQASRQEVLRYSFALLAADRDVRVAKYLGLYAEDTLDKGQEKVFYKVICPLKTDSVVGDILIDQEVTEQVLGIDSVMLEVDRNRAILTWEDGFRRYTSYRVYRSVNGVPYSEIDQELTQAFAQSTQGSRVLVDSIPLQFNTLSYKVSGVDLFGEEGPAAFTRVVTGNYTDYHSVSITNHRLMDDKQVLLQIESSGDVDSLIVEAATDSGKVLFRSNCPCDEEILNVESSAYVVAQAYNQGNKVSSLPYYIHIPDNTPPEPPLVRLVKMDSLNTLGFALDYSEIDVRGYRVYRSFDSAGPFIELTSSPRIDSVYIDSLEVSLTDSAYYKFQTEDLSFNRSEMSLVGVSLNSIKTRTQDFSGYSLRNDTVRVDWEAHPGFNRYLILRIDGAVDTIQTEEYHFMESITGKVKYVLIGVKESGSLGQPSDTLVVSSLPAIASSLKLNFRVNRSSGVVIFDFEDIGKGSAKVYRAKKGTPLRLYRVLEDVTEHFEDRDLKINTTYTYRFHFESPTQGWILSDRIEVEY